MRLLISVITLVLFSFGQAHAQRNYGSANYVLPLCKTWLKVVVETDVDEVGSIVEMEPGQRLNTGAVAPPAHEPVAAGWLQPLSCQRSQLLVRVVCSRDSGPLHWSSDPRTSTRKAVRLGSCGRGLGASRVFPRRNRIARSL
jgi:hypothetical protein